MMFIGIVNFLLYTVAAVGLNLLVSELTKQDPEKPEAATLKSGYGFPLPKPFGTVRLTNLNVIWGKSIRDKKSSSGGFLGIGSQTKYKSYATFAVMGGWGKIEAINKIWINNELVYTTRIDRSNYKNNPLDQDIDLREHTFESVMKALKEKRYFRKIEFFLGDDLQPISEIISRYEGVEQTPNFKHRFYIVFDRLQVDTGSGYPSIDIEVEAYEKTLPEVLTWTALESDIKATQIEIDPALENIQEVNVDFVQNGESAKKFIDELRQIYSFFTIDKGDRLIFRDYDTVAELPVTNLALDNLAAIEGNADIIDRYSKELPDFRELPSELYLEYVSQGRNYDSGLQMAYRHEAAHKNETKVRTRLVLTDEEAHKAVWRNLNLLWAQSRRISGISLLPSVGQQMELGSLFTIPIDGVDRFFQLEKKEIGDNDLCEIEAVSYAKTISNASAIALATFPDPEPAPIPVGTVIALDIPLIDDNHSDLGCYVGVTSPGEFNFGEIYISNDGGSTYNLLSEWSGETIVGEVTQIPNSANPDLIDYGSQIIVSLTNSGTIENVTQSDFLDAKVMGLFGNELIAFQNATLQPDGSYIFSALLRGLRGTERFVDRHTVGERFILLRGNNTFIGRADLTIEDIGKTLYFKVIHEGGADVDDDLEVTSLTITGEGAKPYPPGAVELTQDTVTSDLIISYSLRTRTDGDWRDRFDVTHSDSDRTLVQFLRENSIVHEVEVTGREPRIILTAGEQINYYGSLQTSLDLNIYQISAIIGLGNALEVRGLISTSFF